jgi:hypothetical protein
MPRRLTPWEGIVVVVGLFGLFGYKQMFQCNDNIEADL